MASNINVSNIDPTLAAETSGVNVGKVLKATFIACLTAIKDALTVTKSEIDGLQTTTTNLQAAIAAIGGGTAGSVWRVTSGAPASSLGINGDYVLNTVNGDVYLKASGAYSVVANIKGATGSQGATGNTGSAGAAGRGISGIARTAGTGAAGTTDTYTITFTDSTTTTFSVVNGANGSGGSATAAAYTADVTASKTLATADLSTSSAPLMLPYNSASNGVFTIPLDSVLGLTGLSNAEFVVYQKGTGRIDVAAASGVTINNYAGAPTSTQYVTTIYHRVGANTWSIK